MKRVAEDRTVQRIPLNQLKPSPKNVRTVPHSKYHIKSLAASIEAHGLLQNLIVETEREDGKPTGFYLVTVGEGRRLAQLLCVKNKKIKADEPIPCVIDDIHDGEAVSLAENDVREAMHPADQFAAFKRLIDGGKSIEDVAAQFGVTPLVVQRRLKLANVAPEFIEQYRRDKMGLDQLMALAIVDDHDKQRRVWENLPSYNRDPDSIRRMLTESEIAVNEGIAKFVGIKAYEKAGGLIRRDLFAEREDDRFVMDPELLRRLATEKLEKAATQLKAEGCAWVEVMLDLDYSTLNTYGHVGYTLREPNKKEQTKLDALKAKRTEIEQEIDAAGDSEDDDGSDALYEQTLELDMQIEEVEATLRVPDPQQQAVAGALIAITHGGELRIEKGLLKPEDAKRFRSAKAGKKPTGPRLHSAALTRRLTAHRTIALQAALAEQPGVALVAVAHRLVLRAFYGRGMGPDDPVQLKVEEPQLKTYAEDIEDCKAKVALDARREALSRELPGKAQALFGWLLEQSQDKVLELCAYCVARAINGVSDDENDHRLDSIAEAAHLDMKSWWTPTALGYFGSLPKARILDAVREATSPEVAASLSTMKKTALAAVAEQRLAGSGWLPSLLRPQAH